MSKHHYKPRVLLVVHPHVQRFTQLPLPFEGINKLAIRLGRDFEDSPEPQPKPIRDYGALSKQRKLDFGPGF